MTAPKPRRRTIRFAIVAAACVLLGAATSIAIAWSFAISAPPIKLELETTSYGGASVVNLGSVRRTGACLIYLLAFPVQDSWSGGPSPADSLRYEQLSRLPLGTLASAKSQAFLERDEEVAEWVFEACGWPAACLWFEYGHAGQTSGTWGAIEVSALERPRFFYSRPRPAALPFRPLFPGFALDTALYAAAWYLLLFTPLPLIRAGRRRLRVSRGMCPACGYDLKGSPSGPCPECGKGAGA